MTLAVSDLTKMLRHYRLGPMDLERLTSVSHMTWRRLLARPTDAPIPPKYARLIDLALLSPADAADPLPWLEQNIPEPNTTTLARLELEGLSCPEPELLYNQEVLPRLPLPRRIQALCETLLHSAQNPHSRALIGGALLYLVNPFDLVFDAVIGLGWIDDLAILTLAKSALNRPEEKETK